MRHLRVSSAERDGRQEFHSLQWTFCECYPAKDTLDTINRSRIQLDQYLCEDLSIAVGMLA
jgi:hypothetical protein